MFGLFYFFDASEKKNIRGLFLISKLREGVTRGVE